VISRSRNARAVAMPQLARPIPRPRALSSRTRSALSAKGAIAARAIPVRDRGWSGPPAKRWCDCHRRGLSRGLWQKREQISPPPTHRPAESSAAEQRCRGTNEQGRKAPGRAVPHQADIAT
jgi:hypothetical protein